MTAVTAPAKTFTEIVWVMTPATTGGVFGGTLNYFVWRPARVVRFRGPGAEGLATFEESTDDD